MARQKFKKISLRVVHDRKVKKFPRQSLAGPCHTSLFFPNKVSGKKMTTLSSHIQTISGFQFFGFEKDGKKFVLLRSYRAALKKSSSGRLPRIELEEIGPRVDLAVRRLHLASDDHFTAACRQACSSFTLSVIRSCHLRGRGAMKRETLSAAVAMLWRLPDGSTIPKKNRFGSRLGWRAFFSRS